MLKKCCKCKIEKDVSEFYKNKNLPMGCNKRCIACQKAAAQDYYLKNKDKYKKRAYKNRDNRQDWFREIKSQFVCITCGESHIACLDFHHRNPEEKLFHLGNRLFYTKQEVLDEIQKCDVLCANCHRKLHYN